MIGERLPQLGGLALGALIVIALTVTVTTVPVSGRVETIAPGAVKGGVRDFARVATPEGEFNVVLPQNHLCRVGGAITLLRLTHLWGRHYSAGIVPCRERPQIGATPLAFAPPPALC